MSFIRPEASAFVDRWREVMIGVVVVALGIYWASGFGLLKWVGIVVILIGAALLVAGVQRARFRMGKGGPGVVQVDERQITYSARWMAGPWRLTR